MSDYTQTTDFSAKDDLPSGNAEKVILGADLDVELAAISTAIASKIDDAGLVGDIDDLSDPGADRILFWDDTAGIVTFLSVGTALSISGTTLSADETAINHDNLSGFVADEHVAHSGVTLTAGAGLTGGGTIAASRSFAVGAGTGITVNADDVQLNTAHARNVDHSAVSITAGVGLSGGGTIESTRTLTLDLDELGTETSIASGDFIAMVDITDSGSQKITFANFEATLNHDSLAGFVANEHINHASVTLTAGSGLTGGGTIAASRTFNVGAGDGISVAADSVAVDSTVLRTTGAQSVAGVKTFSDLPAFSGEGQFLHHASSQSGASVTISDSGPSGGANGDIWLEY